MINEVPIEEIEKYLQGRDPQKYIVAVEATYGSQTVNLIVNDPVTGKRIQKGKLRPFLWAKPEGMLALYGGKKGVIAQRMAEKGISVKRVQTSNGDGVTPQRMADGFTLLVEGNCSYGELINFFKKGGVDLYGEEHRKKFITMTIVEQYLIQSGKRLFKGMEDYNDLHRFQFDLETTGLKPAGVKLTKEDVKEIKAKIADPNNTEDLASKYEFREGNPIRTKPDSIFSIGIKDNRGNEAVLEVMGDTEEERRDKELLAIETFFAILDELQPDLIAGYNSENFDFDFFEQRCLELGTKLSDVATTLNPEVKLKRKSSTVKYGSDTEFYEQTIMWGYNIVDIMHAVRRAQAINSNIKKAGLKYITKYSKIAKPNRVYVDGDIIHKTWSDTINKYAHNDDNGEWYKISVQRALEISFKETTGRYIVNRYLLDDLWETEQVDVSFNQASFLLAKLVPTTYSKVSTMGTASLWKLLMCGWSYENRLGVPDYQDKRDFTGGLSRLVECGYAKRVYKFDYAALYPNEQLTHDIFPDLDISGVMKSMLLYIAETRDKFKELKNLHGKRKKEIQAKMAEYEVEGKLTPELKIKCEAAIAKHSRLASDYDKKQLPIKILANSFFGSFGAPYIFPWGDMDSAEEITCRGRQYLRLLVSHFWEKYGFRPLVGDTDGFNFAAPDDVDTFEYIGQGLHRFTEKGRHYTGADAPIAEFNDLYMKGRMGLDIDEVAESTINFKRKNYADSIDGEVKLVGNSIKSKKMEVYIEEFLDVGIGLLLQDKGYEFIEEYQNYVDKIYNYEIPLSKIASKGRIKISNGEYKKKCKTKNKAGNPMPRQAHMELVQAHGLTPDLGDTIYYVNTGDKKSTGDIKSIKGTRDLPFVEGELYKVKGKRPKLLVSKINYNRKTIISFEGTFVGKEEVVTVEAELVAPLTEKTGDVQVELNCMLISKEEIENNADLTTDQYNAERYLDKFNKRLKALLVVFHPDIREDILMHVVKDKKTKVSVLDERQTFKRSDCKLCAGIPYEASDQDTYEELMTMEDKEIRFWTSVDKIPNNIDLDEWEDVKKDYFTRLDLVKQKGIAVEAEAMDAKCKRLEIGEINEFLKLFEKDIDEAYLWVLENLSCDLAVDDEDYYLKSFKWDGKIFGVENIFKYQNEAIERLDFYHGLDFDDLRSNTEESSELSDNDLGYLAWLEYQEKRLAEKCGLSLEQYRESLITE